MLALIKVSVKSGNSRKSEKNQGNGLCLTNIRQKSGNWTSAKIIKEMSGKMFVFFPSINRSSNMLENTCKRPNCAQNIILGFHFPLRGYSTFH